MELEQVHLDGAILLPNREELLNRIPKGGISCEAGVASGGYSRLIIDTMKPKKHYMIDSWAYKGRYDDSMYESVLNQFAPDIDAGRVSIVRGISYKALMTLPDHSIDFIYIDTSHTYKDTRLELEVAKDKITPAGIIAGHDYKEGRFAQEHSRFLRYGVIEAVNEFMVKYEFKLKYLTFESSQVYSFAIQKM